MPAAQLIRIARLRRFVGVFARGGDVEAAAEALLALSRASRAGGLAGESLKRARQAAELFAETDRSATGVRSLIYLSATMLATDVDAAASAAEVARERAELLDEPARTESLGMATLLGGVAHAIRGDEDEARASLDQARDLLVAANHPEGAALALTQHGLLDASGGHWAHADLCFRFARDFYVAAQQPSAASEVSALAARTFAADERGESDAWFRTAIEDADLTGLHTLGAELRVEYGEYLERGGSTEQAAEIAADATRRCALVSDLAVRRPLLLRARMQLARWTEDPAEALRHVDAAFELALDLREPDALGRAIEVVVTGLVKRTYGLIGWRLVDRFRERLVTEFPDLAEAANAALHQLYPLVADEMEREQREEEQYSEPPPPSPLDEPEQAASSTDEPTAP